MTLKVRIEIEFEMPPGHSLTDCIRLVTHQMQTPPEWDDPAGTGSLNYVCYDKTLRVTRAEEVAP